MDGKILARIGVALFVAVTIMATAIEVNRKDGRTDGPATPVRPVATTDPLAVELRRCSQIGEAGPRDSGCLTAWAQNRRRFLGQPAPDRLLPGLPSPADPTGSDGLPADLLRPARPEGR